jgi:uncharacterized membrane protein YkvI
MINRKFSLAFVSIAAAGLFLAAIATLPAWSDTLFSVSLLKPQLFGEASLQAVMEPVLLGTLTAIGLVYAMPALGEAWHGLQRDLAAGAGWCLRAVQDLGRPRSDNAAPVPLFMTGFGPYFTA